LDGHATSVVLSGVGLAVGGLLAFALSSLIRIQLYGLQPHNPFTYVSAAAVLALAAFAAGFIPKEATNNFDGIETRENYASQT